MFKKAWDTLNTSVRDYADRRYFRYVKQQVEVGNKDGQFLLARMYEEGNTTVAQDWVTAYVLYYLSDQKGVKEAKHCLEALRPKLSTESWQEAQAIIRKLDEER